MRKSTIDATSAIFNDIRGLPLQAGPSREISDAGVGKRSALLCSRRLQTSGFCVIEVEYWRLEFGKLVLLKGRSGGRVHLPDSRIRLRGRSCSFSPIGSEGRTIVAGSSRIRSPINLCNRRDRPSRLSKRVHSRTSLPPPNFETYRSPCNPVSP